MIPNNDHLKKNWSQWSIFQSQWMRNRLPFAVVSSHCHHHRHFPQPHQQCWQHHHHGYHHDENEVGSNTVVTGGDGAKYRGREYPWGTGSAPTFWWSSTGITIGIFSVNIEDSKHCDFMALRNLVLAHHMQDLKEVDWAKMFKAPKANHEFYPLYLFRFPLCTVTHSTLYKIVPSQGNPLAPLWELPVH